MPDITFILPHWMYWGGILAVPACLMFAARRGGRRETAPAASLPTAYFFWAVGGFMGLHRLYFKNWGAAVFIALFVGVIWCNHEARQTRNAHSIVKNDAFNAAYDLQRAEEEAADAEVMESLRRALKSGSEEEERLREKMANWRRLAGAIAAVIFVLLLADAAMIRRLARSSRAANYPRPPPVAPPATEAARRRDGNAFGRAASAINGFIGEFVSYWTVIAVFVFYYEVIARYIFNSPTIWAHESMFLLFGMQYMLCGGFCLRENSHVRVDVVYAYMPARARAVCDLITSLFFFIFAAALAATGWIFFHDSFDIGQVSHTEWEIAHWPIKFALPLGGALIFLQGAAHLLRDIARLRGNDGR
ncbi:MAG: TRAP transporter small permease subunit [Gammaproteobacteria bacterium]